MVCNKIRVITLFTLFDVLFGHLVLQTNLRGKYSFDDPYIYGE